jgi:hypothetical protein
MSDSDYAFNQAVLAQLSATDPSEASAQPYPVFETPAGLVAETFPLNRASENQSLVLTSGIPLLAAISLEAGQTAAEIGFMVGMTGAAGITHAWMALVDLEGTVRAVSADTVPTGAAIVSDGSDGAMVPWALPVSAPFTVRHTGDYLLAVSMTATTMPSLLALVDLTVADVSDVWTVVAAPPAVTGQGAPPVLLSVITLPESNDSPLVPYAWVA